VAVTNQVKAEETQAPAMPEPLTKEEVQALVARSVADAIAGAVPAMMAEMMKASVPNYGAAPSQAVHIQTGPDAAPKVSYKKHYRLDDVVSGKYQLINMEKLGDRDIDDLNADEIKDIMMKGKWFHFVHGHAYATSDNEVAFVEKHLTRQGIRFYEDDGGVLYPCPVQGCDKSFGTESGLKNHKKATHGLDEGMN
jgi:hypothetical protein